MKGRKSHSIPGADLCKFYKRPLSSYNVADNLMSETEERSDLNTTSEKLLVKALSQGTQTDYRESSAQTDPWDPPYRVHSLHKDPEVLSLKHLTYGSGLPVGQLEVKYISETRGHKNVTSDIGTSENNEPLKTEKQIICDQVRSDWNYRIEVENRKQSEKLQAMNSDLVEELKRHSARKEKILKNLWTHKNTEMYKRNVKLENKLHKEIVALESKHDTEKHIAKDLVKDSVVKQKVNKGRYDNGIDYMLSTYYLSDPAGLMNIKDWIERKADGLIAEIPLSVSSRKTQRARLIEEAYENIVEKNKTKLLPKVYREDYESEEAPSPPPPLRAENDPLDFQFNYKQIDLVTVWQKTLRGLAYQKQMLELIDHHKEGLSTILSPLYPDLVESR